jgi:hypothetical protein
VTLRRPPATDRHAQTLPHERIAELLDVAREAGTAGWPARLWRQCWRPGSKSRSSVISSARGCVALVVRRPTSLTLSTVHQPRPEDWKSVPRGWL